MAEPVSDSRTLDTSPSLMQAAQTMQIAHPKIQHALIDPMMPTGIALCAFFASSLQWIVESNAPIVQIAGIQLNAKDQSVP